jgi:rod shape-determining protein MreD
MKRLFLPLFLLVFLVLESTAITLLPEEWIHSGNFLIPHWTLVFCILIAVFYDRDHTYYCLLYAIIFGFLIDLTYTNILGVYMFSYGLVVFICHELKRMLHPNFIVAFMLTFVGLVISEHLLYFMYYMIGQTDLIWTSYAKSRLIPTILGNILFLLIIYPLFKNKLQVWSDEHFPEK